MGMAENTRERGREQAGMSREGRRTMEKVLENTVRDSKQKFILPYGLISFSLFLAYPHFHCHRDNQSFFSKL